MITYARYTLANMELSKLCSLVVIFIVLELSYLSSSCQRSQKQNDLIHTQPLLLALIPWSTLIIRTPGTEY